MASWRLEWVVLYFAVAAIVGAWCSSISNRRIGVLASGLVPWLLSLAWFGFREFYWPYEGSGVFLWLMAQLVWGTMASFVGLVGYVVMRRWRRKGNIGAF